MHDDQDQLIRKFGSKGAGKGQFQKLHLMVMAVCMFLSLVTIECRNLTTMATTYSRKGDDQLEHWE